MYVYVEKGLITEEQYQMALAFQKRNRITFQESLLKLSFIREENVVKYCDKILGH